jgi:hypothetical protein
MEREFISYEQALALKELGFDGETIKVYSTKWVKLMEEEYAVRYDVDYAKAPLKQQVFRFFREKYGWYLDLGHSERVDFYYAILKNSEPIEWRNDYSTYEEAENACIDKLISIAQEHGKD